MGLCEWLHAACIPHACACALSLSALVHAASASSVILGLLGLVLDTVFYFGRRSVSVSVGPLGTRQRPGRCLALARLAVVEPRGFDLAVALRLRSRRPRHRHLVAPRSLWAPWP